jgi:CRISPR/Cas system-associated exonuclease Cas4 (RecB family)
VLKNSALLPPKKPSHAGVRMSSKPEELKFPLVEKFLVSNELGIFGKPDFVFLEDDTLTIYDYKFGRNQDDLEKYRFQMLFYQLLVESVTNLKVGKLAIVASASRVFEISVQKSDVENFKAEIPRVLNAIKSSNVVAIPSQRNCKFCSFKAVCESFKRANIELHPGRPMAILGEIIAAKRIDSEFQELTVKTILMSEVENFRVFGIPNSHFFEVGESVFISDNLEFMDEKTIKFSWNSRISLEG